MRSVRNGGGKGIPAATSCVLALVLLNVSCSERPRSTTAVKIIPAQTLRFVDNSERQFASLHFGADGSAHFELRDANGAIVARFGRTAEGDAAFSLLSASSSASSGIHVMLPSEVVFVVSTPDGKLRTIYGKGWQGGSLRDVFVVALHSIYRKVFPRKPYWTLDRLLPTQNLRLTRREGYHSAVLGLSELGEPGLVLTDDRGRILLCWGLAEKRWSVVHLFDKSGERRVTVEMGPSQEPVLTITERGAGVERAEVYVLDPVTCEEVLAASAPRMPRLGSIPWLRHEMFRATVPIVLLDQRDNTVWRAP